MLLVYACAAQAQSATPVGLGDSENAPPGLAAKAAPKITLFDQAYSAESIFASSPASVSSLETLPVALPFASLTEPAEPETPLPEPRFVFGGRDDYRWQLGLAATWLRFQSNVFNASAVGIKTSISYFTNDWFGIEGNVTAAFAPQIFDKEHVKLLTYGGGPKIAWRQKQWEPWLHAIFGGAHEQPQVVGQGRNTYSIQAGGGADYRWQPHLAFRLEGDYVLTGFFGHRQNDFQLAGGIVFHF
jgi:hypothetical protein